MPIEFLPAFAEYLTQFPSSKAGDYEGRLVTVYFVGGDNNGKRVTLIDYDAYGVRVKDSAGGSPSETQFYFWHTIASIR